MALKFRYPYFMSTAKRVSVSEASRNFSDFINRVAYCGERFVLIKGNKPVAEISPVVSGRKLGDLVEIFRELPRLDEDSDFSKEIKQIRSKMNKGEIRNPWES